MAEVDIIFQDEPGSGLVNGESFQWSGDIPIPRKGEIVWLDSYYRVVGVTHADYQIWITVEPAEEWQRKVDENV